MDKWLALGLTVFGIAGIWYAVRANTDYNVVGTALPITMLLGGSAAVIVGLMLGTVAFRLL